MTAKLPFNVRLVIKLFVLDMLYLWQMRCGQSITFLLLAAPALGS